MFLGVSKNVGGGFRIGVGTKLGSKSKQPSSKELKTKEFVAYLKKVETDINDALMIFLKANGQDFYQLKKSKVDLDELFSENEKYTEFISLYNNAKQDIDKILYTGDSGVVAKRGIADAVFTVKNFIEKEYPNVTSPRKQKGFFSKVFSLILKSILAFFILLFVIALFSDKTKDTTKENKSVNKVVETKK